MLFDREKYSGMLDDDFACCKEASLELLWNRKEKSMKSISIRLLCPIKNTAISWSTST